MDILKAFVLDGKDYNITIKWQDEKPLFRASEIAKVLDIQNISKSLQTFSPAHKVITSSYTPGGVQDTLFMTESGLYKLLMRSRKAKAEPFQEWVTQVLISIRENGKYELEIKLQETKQHMLAQTQEQITLALQQAAVETKQLIDKCKTEALIEAFKDKYVTYVGIIKYIGDKILIKIGSSKNIGTRCDTLIKQYGTFTIVKLFECPCNEAFEKFLHNHAKIKPHRYDKPIYDNYVSTETFLVSQDELQFILRIANHNKYKFSSVVDFTHVKELELIKLQQIESQTQLAHLQQNNIEKNNKDIYVDPVILLNENRKHTQTRGNKIQKYSADGKTLIQTYDSYAFAIRDPCVELSRTCLKDAVKNCTVYKDYRWAELERSLPDDTIQILDSTQQSKEVKTGYVAMLNLDKTQIVKVFCDQKAAADDRKFTSSASVSKAIKQGSQSSGHYFMMWNQCSQELKEHYLQQNILPDKRSAGQRVEQRHPITEEVITTYACIEDVVKKFKISRQTLKSACEYHIVSKGYKWSFV